MRNEWQDKHIVVIGLARSGVAVAKLLHQLGAKVLVNDAKPREKCPEAEELEKLGVAVICGGHPEGLITEEVDLVVKNPGVPYRVTPIQQALQQKIPVVTEIEIASKLSLSPIIGITGSNGKTTTTTLVGCMLAKGGVNARVAGNIGQALAEVIQDLSSQEWLVAELSSFQLKGTKNFSPKIAALLNLVPAHLDYHETMEDYAKSKVRIFQNQTAEDFAVLNWDHPFTRQLGESHEIKSQIVWFSREEPVENGAFVKDGWIWYRLNGHEAKRLLPVNKVRLPGSFNLENCLAATVISLCAGADVAGIQEVLSTFTGVEHRLEFVRELHGIRFYNDSKATNSQAASKALSSFTEPIIWIAGGLDRGVDFQELVPLLKERVKAVVAYGQTAPIFQARAADAGVNCVVVKEIEESVEKAASLAENGDIVLLSPACASWDLYTSFEERGSIFKQAVHRLV